jgi:hypothetical protein
MTPKTKHLLRQLDYILIVLFCTMLFAVPDSMIYTGLTWWGAIVLSTTSIAGSWLLWNIGIEGVIHCAHRMARPTPMPLQRLPLDPVRQAGGMPQIPQVGEAKSQVGRREKGGR